jgi:hypothetical protein
MGRARLGGWWRLWIVTTTVYAAAVAAFVGYSFPRVEGLLFEEGHIKLLSTRSREILAGRTQPASTLADPEWKRAPFIFEMPNGHRFEVPGNTPIEQAEELARDYMAVLLSLTKQRRNEALGSALLIWIVPSLLLLAAGWGIGWVYRGFRPVDAPSKR